MDTRLLGPKGMNGLKQHQTTSSDQLAHHAPAQLPPPVDTTWESSHTPPSGQTHPQYSRYTPRCPSVVLWTPCSGVERGVFEPTIRVWRSGSTRKQPANLAVEGAEESLTILPDYTPTIRPPPKRC
jgi:hypothetical protein